MEMVKMQPTQQRCHGIAPLWRKGNLFLQARTCQEHGVAEKC